MSELSVLDKKITYIKIEDGDFFVSDWLRNRNTIEFLGIWEEIHNPDFNYGEFAIIKSQAGLNNYKISVKEWTKKTNAIGVISKSGRYRIHTDAIKNNLVPPELTKLQINFIYAEEADVLNMALFGITAKQWKAKNFNLDGNVRDYATINELICLANLENLNAVFINDGFKQH